MRLGIVPDNFLERLALRSGLLPPGIFECWFGIMLALVLLLYATKTGSDFSRQWLGVWGALAFLSLILVRIAAIFVLRALHRRPTRAPARKIPATAIGRRFRVDACIGTPPLGRAIAWPRWPAASGFDPNGLSCETGWPPGSASVEEGPKCT